MEVPGIGSRELRMRDRILVEYHNSVLGGHLGRDKTYMRLERDWWWPGMYSDVVRWCKHCLACQKENSRTALSAWSRTEFYDRPFRVIQIDVVTCAESGGEPGEVTGAKYILTAICCFSRWVWLVAIRDKEAETLGKALLERVLIGMAMFPTVIRSDNDSAFLSNLFMYINRMLNIHHITGSVYHPQSQGIVENMHRTLNGILRKLVGESPSTWEAMLPYAECIIRMTPLDSLVGRSPYQVVTGLTPKMPRALVSNVGVINVGVDSYVTSLIGYLRDCYSSIQNQVKAVQQKNEMEASDEGTFGQELEVGDVVMIRRDPTDRRQGPRRFQSKVRDELYVVDRKISPHTFQLRSCWNTAKMAGTHHAINLIKVHMPNVELEDGQLRVIEVFRNTVGDWARYRIERHGPDGRCFVKRMRKVGQSDEWTEDGVGMWTDLSTELYRWIV